MVFFDFDCWMNSEARSAISASGPILVSVGRSERMRSVGIRERRLNLDTLPLSGVRTVLSSGNCQTSFSSFSDLLPALGGAAGASTNQATILLGDGIVQVCGNSLPPHKGDEHFDLGIWHPSALPADKQNKEGYHVLQRQVEDDD